MHWNVRELRTKRSARERERERWDGREKMVEGKGMATMGEEKNGIQRGGDRESMRQR